METAIKLEKRKEQSEERMSRETDDGESVPAGNVFEDLDNAEQGSIKLKEGSGLDTDASKEKTDGVQKTSAKEAQGQKGRNISSLSRFSFTNSLI